MAKNAKILEERAYPYPLTYLIEDEKIHHTEPKFRVGAVVVKIRLTNSPHKGYLCSGERGIRKKSACMHRRTRRREAREFTFKVNRLFGVQIPKLT